MAIVQPIQNHLADTIQKAFSFPQSCATEQLFSIRSLLYCLETTFIVYFLTPSYFNKKQPVIKKYILAHLHKNDLD